MTSPLLKTIDLDFVYLELYENFIISSIKEGVLFDRPQLDVFYAIFDTYYPDKNFGYISDRKFDYTVNPTSYLESSKYPRLMGIAICCHSEKRLRTANFEKAFYERPFQAFMDKELAISWIQNLIRSKNNIVVN